MFDDWSMLKTIKPFSVIGHNIPDLDSMASAVAVAEILGGTPAKAGAIDFSSEKPWMDLGGPVLTDLCEPNLVLVDCRVSPVGGTVTSIIDHHRVVPNDVPVPIIWANIGATATLVAEYGLSMLSPATKRLLAAAIISDTKNLLSVRTTKRDIDMLPLLDKNWKDIIPAVFPVASTVPIEKWRVSGLKMLEGIPWAAGDGWGQPPDLDMIPEKTRGTFIFSWINMSNATTTVAIYKDGFLKKTIKLDYVANRGEISRRILDEATTV